MLALHTWLLTFSNKIITLQSACSFYRPGTLFHVLFILLSKDVWAFLLFRLHHSYQCELYNSNHRDNDGVVGFIFRARPELVIFVFWQIDRYREVLQTVRGVAHLLVADPRSGCLISPASACGSIAASHRSRLAEAQETRPLLQKQHRSRLSA